jgi:hypothetical protein
MHMQNTANGLCVLAAVQEQDRVQTLGDAAVIGLFEATPHFLALGTAQGKQLLTHRLRLLTHKLFVSYQQWRMYAQAAQTSFR